MDETRSLARKLQPILGAKVNRWIRGLDFASPRTRSLIRSRIQAEAREHLGTGVHLPIPDARVLHAEFVIGTAGGATNRLPFGIRRQELLEGVGIWGRSGSGKTNIALVLMRELARAGVSWVFFDHKRTGRESVQEVPTVRVLRGRELRFNPFQAPPGAHSEEYRARVLDILCRTHTLGNGARSLVNEALVQLGAGASPSELADYVEDSGDGARKSGWKETAVRALRSIADSVGEGGASVSTLARGHSVVELDGLGAPERTFFTETLLLWLYQYQLENGKREELSLVVFLEEAHNVLSDSRSTEDFVDVFLRQCRELGIGVVTLDQSPSKISPSALQNSAVSACMSQAGPSDIRAVQAITGVQDRDYFGRLRTGEGIVNTRSRPQVQDAFLVRFEKSGIEKNKSSKNWSENTRPSSHSPQEPSDGRQRGTDGTKARQEFPDGAQEILQDVHDHPTSPLRDRYARIGLSAHSGTKLKRQLVDLGLLAEQVVPMGTTRVHALKDLRGIRESPAHYFWKHYYAAEMRRRGYSVEVEAPRVAGRVDVLAIRAGIRIGIEVETGRSRVAGNVVACLLSQFDFVVVAAVSRNAHRRVEKVLEHYGLLTSGRVVTLLCGTQLPIRD